MFKYILKRIGISILVLFGVSVVIYMIVRLMQPISLKININHNLRMGK